MFKFEHVGGSRIINCGFRVPLTCPVPGHNENVDFQGSESDMFNLLLEYRQEYIYEACYIYRFLSSKWNPRPPQTPYPFFLVYSRGSQRGGVRCIAMHDMSKMLLLDQLVELIFWFSFSCLLFRRFYFVGSDVLSPVVPRFRMGLDDSSPPTHSNTLALFAASHP